MGYEVLKVVHVASMVAWVAGLLVAPAALASGAIDKGTVERLLRHFRTVTTPAMILAWISGLTLAVWGGWFKGGWFHGKMALVILLSGLHGALLGRMRKAAGGATAPAWISTVSFVALVAMTAAVAFARLKPF